MIQNFNLSTWLSSTRVEKLISTIKFMTKIRAFLQTDSD